jgi:hypothetical protein
MTQTPEIEMAVAEGKLAKQEFLDVNDAVTYLRDLGARAASLTFVRGLIARREVSFKKIGKRFYIRQSSLRDWLSRRERR